MHIYLGQPEPSELDRPAPAPVGISMLLFESLRDAVQPPGSTRTPRAPEPGGGRHVAIWNGYGTQCSHPARGRLPHPAVVSRTVSGLRPRWMIERECRKPSPCAVQSRGEPGLSVLESIVPSLWSRSSLSA